MIEAPIKPDLDDPPMPFVEHLTELRQRLIMALSIWGAGTAVMYRYSGMLMSWLARPVGSIFFIAPTEAFHTRVKIALYGGFILSLPLILHQVWLFVARALDHKWRR